MYYDVWLYLHEEWDRNFEDYIEFDPNARVRNEARSDWMRIWRNIEQNAQHQISIAKSMGEIQDIVARALKERDVIFAMGKFTKRITTGGLAHAARKRIGELVGFEPNSDYCVMLRGGYATPVRSTTQESLLKKVGFRTILYSHAGKERAHEVAT